MIFIVSAMINVVAKTVVSYSVADSRYSVDAYTLFNKIEFLLQSLFLNSITSMLYETVFLDIVFEQSNQIFLYPHTHIFP